MTGMRVLVLLAISLLTLPGAAAQSVVTQVLWRDPGDIGDRDLYWGSGSEERQPAPPFVFMREDTSGSKPKVRVIDAKGVLWNVKFAGEREDKNEVHAEIAANRVAWALGYISEESYFIPRGRIDGARDLERAQEAIARDGSFRTARFERRDPNVERGQRRWTFESNPFAGTKELSGLKLLLALVNNWDNKPDNTLIETVTTAAGAQEERFIVSDWGASFGRMSGPPSWRPAPTRWQAADYREQPFVKGVIRGVYGDSVQLYFLGQVPMDSVPLDHARWFVELASQLHEKQLRKAFEAAGGSERDAHAFADRVVDKIKELRSAVQSASR